MVTISTKVWKIDVTNGNAENNFLYIWMNIFYSRLKFMMIIGGQTERLSFVALFISITNERNCEF